MTSESQPMLCTEALEHVAPDFRTQLQKFKRRLDGLFGARLLNWTLFGWAAAGEQPTLVRRAQHVLILDRIDLDPLRQLAPEGQIFGPAGLAAPLIMTPAYVQTSLDSFPLEFIEIHLQYLTLCGDDVFGELEIHDHDVRLACEREVKALLLGLRQGLLSAGDNAELLAEVVTAIVISLRRLLAGLCWLKGHRAYLPPPALLAQVETVTGHSLGAIRASFEVQQTCHWQQFVNLYDDMETLRKIIDAW